MFSIYHIWAQYGGWFGPLLAMDVKCVGEM